MSHIPVFNGLFPLKALSTLPLNCVDAASDRKPIGVNWQGNARYRAIFVDFNSQGGQHGVTWYLRHFKLESAVQNKNKPLLSGYLKSYELTESWPISAGLSWGNGELRTLHTSAYDSLVYFTIRVGKPKNLFYLGYENVFSFRVLRFKRILGCRYKLCAEPTIHHILRLVKVLLQSFKKWETCSVSLQFCTTFAIAKNGVKVTWAVHSVSRTCIILQYFLASVNYAFFMAKRLYSILKLLFFWISFHFNSQIIFHHSTHFSL